MAANPTFAWCPAVPHVATALGSGAATRCRTRSTSPTSRRCSQFRTLTAARRFAGRESASVAAEQQQEHIDPESLVARIVEELRANPAAQRLLLRTLLTNELLGMPGAASEHRAGRLRLPPAT